MFIPINIIVNIVIICLLSVDKMSICFKILNILGIDEFDKSLLIEILRNFRTLFQMTNSPTTFYLYDNKGQ